jgi:hypothetical protein
LTDNSSKGWFCNPFSQIIGRGFGVALTANQSCANLSISATGDGLSSLNMQGFNLTIIKGVDAGQNGNLTIMGGGGGSYSCGSFFSPRTCYWSSSAQLSMNGGILAVGGDINLSSNHYGYGTISLSGTSTLRLAGYFDKQFSGNFNFATSSTVNYNGTSVQTINFNGGLRYPNLQIDNTSTDGATLNAAITASNVFGDLTIQSGTLTNGGYEIALAPDRNFSVANGATFRLLESSGMVTVSGTGTKNSVH